ncbi:MAG: DUF1566 domain-containing protein [candidate division WWE3 bacterium]|nr:DUF1566 domain-containing protein [candidate division WWE3 bacterium]
MRKFLIYSSLIILTLFVIFKVGGAVLAEQSGSSPDSGASTSKIKTISTAVAALSYGSISAGTWGDWGTMWNRIYSAAIVGFNDSLVAGLKNGSGTGTIVAYTKALGGVDDYNYNQTIPSDTYKRTWVTCNSGNTYCGTGRSVLNGLVSQDPNTNLVWSPQINASSTWFVANNCIPPGSSGNLGYPAGTCVNNGDVSCVCVKNTSPKTGCENYDDGLWRLPYQKELMQSYIDGSWGNLATASAYYWASATTSNATQYAWYTFQASGYTYTNSKTVTYSVRCVR